MVKIIFRFSKDKRFDRMFFEESVVEDAMRIISIYFLEGEQIMRELTTKTIQTDSKMVPVQNTK